MEENKKPASEAASILGRKSVETRKAKLGTKGFSEAMRKAAQQPRPGGRKKLSTGQQN